MNCYSLFCFVDDNNNGTDARMNVVDSGTVNNTDTATSVSFSPESPIPINTKKRMKATYNSSGSSSSSDTKRKDQQNDTKLNIYKCLNKFVEREQLNTEETLYCSQCKQHLAPVKKLDLYATPDILIIQLKRFQYIPGQYFVHR